MAVRPDDHAPRCGQVGQLPAVLGREAHARLAVGQGGVRGQAVEHQDVTRLVVRRAPAALEPLERPVAHPGRGLAARQQRQAAEADRHVAQGNPAGEHVLHRPVVLVDHVAGLARHERRRVHQARDLERVAEAGRPHHLAHERGERRVEGDGVEPGVGHDAPVAAVAEGVAHGHGAHGRPGRGGDRVAPALGPAGPLQRRQPGPADVGDPFAVEQSPHEDVAVAADEPAQRLPVPEEGPGVDQFGSGRGDGRRRHGSMVHPPYEGCVKPGSHEPDATAAGGSIHRRRGGRG